MSVDIVRHVIIEPKIADCMQGIAQRMSLLLCDCVVLKYYNQPSSDGCRRGRIEMDQVEHEFFHLVGRQVQIKAASALAGRAQEFIEAQATLFKLAVLAVLELGQVVEGEAL